MFFKQVDGRENGLLLSFCTVLVYSALSHDLSVNRNRVTDIPQFEELFLRSLRNPAWTSFAIIFCFIYF